MRPQCQNCAHREITCDFAQTNEAHDTSLVQEIASPAQPSGDEEAESSSDGLPHHRRRGHDQDENDSIIQPADVDVHHSSQRPPHQITVSRPGPSAGLSLPSSPLGSALTVEPFVLPNLQRSQRITELAVGDLELLHHFSTVTYATLADACASTDNRELWQVHAVQLGFKHEFLLRAILTVSALHLRYLHPARSSYYDFMASTHQNFALETARDALTRVNEDNCHAIFTFSCLIVIMTSASLRKQGGIDAHQEILEWFLLLRGCNSVLQLHWATLGNSFLYPLIDEVRQTETKPTHAIKDVDRIMDLLTSCCFSSATEDLEASKAYTMTVYELTKTFSQVSILRDRGQGLILSCCIWPNTIPQRYLELLRDQKAEALVILAHYAVLLHWADDEWFMRGMARYLLDTIRSSLGKDWQNALRWPSSVIGSHIADIS